MSITNSILIGINTFNLLFFGRFLWITKLELKMLDLCIPEDSSFSENMEMAYKFNSFKECLNLKKWTFNQFFPHAYDFIKFS